MCVVTTELSYGILIRRFDLSVAARAHEEFQGPILAVRMIARRQREGTLVVGDGAGRMERVTKEMWDMVRKEVVKGAFVTGTELELKYWRCDNARECPCRNCWSNHLPRWESPNCEACVKSMTERNGLWDGTTFNVNTLAMGHLLKAYGLERKQELNKCQVDNECWFDFDAAYLIGRTTEEKVFIKTTINHDEPDRMLTQTQVPTLVQDPATDARLRALISDYQLPISTCAIPTYPGYTSTSKEKGGGTWTTWTTCVSCI